MESSRHGVLYAVAAFGVWGLFPLYWPLLEPAGALEILAHRILWSLVLVLALIAATHGLRRLRGHLHDPRRLALSTLAGLAVGANWGIYIWAVNNGHVVEAALGYFVTPLVTVLLGVLVLHERLRRAQTAGLVLCAAAVLVLALAYGQVPWIALSLAASFSTYGLLKKLAGLPTFDAVAVETAALAAPALALVLWLHADARATFTTHGSAHALLLATGGAVTLTPLLLFGAAVARSPLSTTGLVQYLTPVIQLILGTALRHEPLPPSRLAGFLLVWLALAILMTDALRHRPPRAPTPEAVTGAAAQPSPDAHLPTVEADGT